VVLSSRDAIASAGERKAWELLAAGQPADICARAAVSFDAGTGTYRIRSFGRDYAVNPGERRILGPDPGDDGFLNRHRELLGLAVLWYLVKAASDSPSGKLVRPSSLPGGDIFSRGTHVLPLDALAARYATRPEVFLAAGAGLGGQPAPYGDGAVQFPALPKVPVTLILWTASEEFPARADLLFDATAPRHLPTDVLWGVALLSVQLLLHPST
jgi:hypothetical protein